MSAKTELEAAIQASADASGKLILRVGLGAPDNVVIIDGEAKDTGLAYDEPSSMGSILTGVGAVFGSRGTVFTGLTNGSGGALVAGEAVRISATNAVSKASAASAALGAAFVGFVHANAANGAPVEIRAAGVVPALFAGGLTPLVGEYAYLSTTAGRLTNVAPGVPGQILLRAGVIADISGYAGSQTVSVVLLASLANLIV